MTNLGRQDYADLAEDQLRSPQRHVYEAL
jgi:hypothetical protein